MISRIQNYREALDLKCTHAAVRNGMEKQLCLYLCPTAAVELSVESVLAEADVSSLCGLTEESEILQNISFDRFKIFSHVANGTCT